MATLSNYKFLTFVTFFWQQYGFKLSKSFYLNVKIGEMVIKGK